MTRRLTLQQLVRDQIGAEGPQLPKDQYEERIDRVLNSMSNSQLLWRLSEALPFTLGYDPTEKL